MHEPCVLATYSLSLRKRDGKVVISKRSDVHHVTSRVMREAGGLVVVIGWQRLELAAVAAAANGRGSLCDRAWSPIVKAGR